jgi:hypothetical protein
MLKYGERWEGVNMALNIKQKEQIIELRKQDMGYRTIEKQLG